MARRIDLLAIARVPLIIVMPRNFTSEVSATLLFSLFTRSLSFFSINSLIPFITRSADLCVLTNILQSSANRQNSNPRDSISLSSSSNTRLLNKGLSGLPCVVPSFVGVTTPSFITPLRNVMPTSFSILLSSIRLLSRPIRRSWFTLSKNFDRSISTTYPFPVWTIFWAASTA